MKYLKYIILLMANFCFSQNEVLLEEKYNNLKNLKDRNFDKELLIIYGNINYFEKIFHLYFENGQWFGKLYIKHMGDGINVKNLTFNKNNTKDSVYGDFIWEFLKSKNAFYLPNEDEILYKLTNSRKVEFNDNQIIIEKAFNENEFLHMRKFTLFIKDNEKINLVKYYNPYDILNFQNEIDEFTYFKEILEFIQTEFNFNFMKW